MSEEEEGSENTLIKKCAKRPPTRAPTQGTMREREATRMDTFFLLAFLTPSAGSASIIVGTRGPRAEISE